MSAVMTIVERDCVHMITDGAIYDQDGVFLYDWQKTTPIPGANAVFATRGPVFAFVAVLAALQEFEFSNFDELRRQIEQVAVKADEILGHDPFELIVAGWSDESSRGEVLFRQTHGSSMHRSEPGVCYLMGDRAGFGVAIAQRWNRDEVLTRFEEARAFQDDITCGRGEPIMGFSVGGKVWHAVVRPGVAPEFEILREWDDVPGEKINSRPALPVAA